MSGDGEVVRGAGHAPGQGPGEQMPTVPAVERASLGDFQRMLRERDANGGKPPAAAPQARQAEPQTAGGRIGKFSEALEAKQQAPVSPGEKPGEQAADPDAEPAETPEADPSAPPLEEPDAEQAQAALDDKAALERYRAWEQGDMFPDELAGKLHEVKVAGQMRYVDTNELRQGFMSGGETRRLQLEAKQHVERAQRAEQSIQEHFAAIRDPDTFIEMYERNGFDDEWQENVARKVAERVRDRRGIVEAAGLAAMRRLGVDSWEHRDVVAAMQKTEGDLRRMRKLDAEQRRLEYERGQLTQTRQQTEQQAKTEEYKATYDRQIAQLRPNAFKAHGIQDTAGNRQALFRHLSNVFAVEGFTGDITRDHLMKAASDLAEEQAGRLASERGGETLSPQEWAGKRPRAGKPLPPNRMGVGGGAPLGNNNGQKRGSISDLEEMVRKGRMGGR